MDWQLCYYSCKTRQKKISVYEAIYEKDISFTERQHEVNIQYQTHLCCSSGQWSATALLSGWATWITMFQRSAFSVARIQLPCTGSLLNQDQQKYFISLQAAALLSPWWQVKQAISGSPKLVNLTILIQSFSNETWQKWELVDQKVHNSTDITSA